MIKTVLKSMREHKKGTILTMLLSMTEVVFEIVIPLCMANLIDYGIEKSNMNQVWLWGIALLGVAVLQLASGVFAAKVAACSSVGFAANLRSDMYDKVQTFSFSNIDKFSSASIVTRLTTDVTNIQNAYQMATRLAIRAPFMLLFSMIVSFTIDAKISLIFLAAIPLLALVLFLIIRKVHPVFHDVFKTYDKLNNIVQENVRGVRAVKSFNREKSEIEKFHTVSDKIYKGFSKAERLIAFNSPVMQFCVYACMILISWFGAKTIIASGNNPNFGLTTGDLTALFSYTIQILMSLMMLSMIFSMLTIASASLERVAEILSEESDITSPDNAVTVVKDGSITYRNVSFAYASKAEKNVLSDINLDIPTGATVGIIGGTGSSKSSLVHLIPRIYDVSSGELFVGGVNVKEYNIEALRDAVAMVLQKNELFSGTINENIRWGNADASDEEIREACRLACADEFISSFPEGYDTYIEQGGTNVSGGQKQRLCIARALLKKPKILILDDSTSAVDTKTDALIQRAFKEYIPETTKIIIAQRISSVENADMIIVLDDGVIQNVGTHTELLESSQIYREVYESQSKGGKKDE